MKKRIISILLSLCMFLSLVPTTAFAVSSEYKVTGYTALEGTAGFSGEGYGNLVDGDTNTKWCTKNFTDCFIVFAASSAVNVSGYTFTTANDNAENTGRNPGSWKLYGCNDYVNAGTGTWTEIHSITNDTMLQDDNHISYDYFFERTKTAYKFFKLVIGTNKGSDVMQVSEFALISCDHSWNSVITEPTCTTSGYTTETCKYCNGEIISDPMPALGHNIGDNGICSNCGKTEIEIFSYPYLDENGNQQSHYRPQVIDSDITTLSGTAENPGWYIVNNNVTINSRVTVSGNANLILADGCTLVVNGGIRVEEPDSLTVYGQSEGETAGTLVATEPADYDAAIGGNGRTVKDGGNGANGGTVTINSGIVQAYGEKGAGIGGGAGMGGGNGGTVTINGGVVYAYSSKGSGIGGGAGYDRGGDGGNVTASGGFIDVRSYSADAIGGGFGYTQLGYFEQNNGGSGTFSTGANGSAVVYARGYRTAIADMSGMDGWSGLFFDDYDGRVLGTSFVLREDCEIRDPYTLTVTEGSKLTIADGVTLRNYNSMTNNGTIVNNSYFENYGTSIENRGTINNNGYFINHEGSTVINFGTINNDGTITNYGVITDNGVFNNKGDFRENNQLCSTVSFLWDYGEVRYSTDFKTLSSESTTWNNCMYVADGDVTINGRVTVNGNVELVLADGCSLTINGGIQVGASSTLAIYVQSTGENVGRLNIRNVATYDAGIGGNGNVEEDGKTCGTIDILGGNITVESTKGAAIGGGGSENGNGGNGGTVRIYDGNVTASSTKGAAIGGGSSVNGNAGNGGTVEINDGTVIAESTDGAGIGGGSGAIGGSGATVTAFGGNITANSVNGYGIGGGKGVDGMGGPGVFETDLYGRAIINTTSIADQTGKDSWCCLTVIGDEIHAYSGNFWLYEDFTVKKGQTLTVGEDCNFYIDESVTLTNNGTVINNGTIENRGTIANKGNFNNNGIVYNNGTFTGVNYYTVTFDMNDEYIGTVKQCIFDNGPNTAVFPYSFGGDDYEFVGWYNGDTKYDLNEPVTEDITLTAKWVCINVTTPEELENVVALGASDIRLLADITLSKPLDLSDLDIYFNLNGHTLKGDIYIGDTPAGAESRVRIANGNNMLEGVIDGSITLTDGGDGTVSRIVADEGTVTGDVNLESSIAEIANSGVRDRSTSFKGNVYGVGSIHGGTFYGKVNKELIKEPTVIFMNDGRRYAIQAVSSDGWPVEPAYSPFRSEEEPFLGWYDGDRQYGFGYFRLSEDIVLQAKFGDHNYVYQETASEHPHQITWVCSYCGGVKKENTVDDGCLECDFNITLNETDTYEFSAYIGTKTSVTVPSEFNGKPVTEIGTSCFKANKTIEEVVLSEGITSIGSLAFMRCSNLTKVTIPASVTSIGSYAFYGFKGTIYCTKGSYAHEFALANNIDYVLTDAQESVNLIEAKGNTRIDDISGIIYITVENCHDVKEFLNVSDYASVVPVASYSYGESKYYGTGSLITVFDKGEYATEYTLVVTGDVNGDSVCDALDVSQVALVSAGLSTLSGAYKTAADSNGDGTVDVDDYQSIVNICLA